jgi:hypothetical protein
MHLKCEKTKYYTDNELEVCFSASPKYRKEFDNTNQDDKFPLYFPEFY